MAESDLDEMLKELSEKNLKRLRPVHIEPNEMYRGQFDLVFMLNDRNSTSIMLNEDELMQLAQVIVHHFPNRATSIE